MENGLGREETGKDANAVVAVLTIEERDFLLQLLDRVDVKMTQPNAVELALMGRAILNKLNGQPSAENVGTCL